MKEPHIQSALDAARGSGAALLEELGVVLYIGGALIFFAVIALACYGVFADAKHVRARRWMIGGGLIFPIVTLTALLIYSLLLGNHLEAHAPHDALRIHVVGKQWWWEVRYERPGSSEQVVLANELHIPVGEHVELLLSTSDVIHSFWVPSLAGKVDMIPGRVNRLALQTDEAGVYRGQCAEYCGGQHAWMAFFVVAESPEQFRTWLERQAQPVAIPDDPWLKLGYEQFLRGECGDCHAVRGTNARGTRGPDLTHVGSRRSLAAGMLNNHIGTMAGWIAGAQDVKPDNVMPSTDVYSGRELRAVSAWLGSLE